MINIYEYIINKNTKVVKNSDFKKFKTKKEVCDFFENKGFEKATYDDYYYMVSRFLNSKTSIYCTGEFNEFTSNWWVRFGNGGKNEYIFFWNVKDTIGKNSYSVRYSNDHIIKKFETFEEFKEYIIEYFNWK